MMHYTTEQLNDNLLLFRFTAPAEDYTAALGRSLARQQIPLPGARHARRQSQPRYDRAVSRQRRF